MIKKSLCILLTSLACSSAMAQDVSFFELLKSGKTFFQVSGAMGGDAVAQTSEGDELGAGDAFTLSFGRDARFSDRSKRFLRFSLGLKYGILQADDGDAIVSALRINALYMQQTAKLTYGAGLGLHLNPEVEVPTGDATADTAIGLNGQIGYRLSTDSELGLIIDIVDYDFDSGSGSANAIGAFYTRRFSN